MLTAVNNPTLPPSFSDFKFWNKNFDQRLISRSLIGNFLYVLVKLAKICGVVCDVLPRKRVNNRQLNSSQTSPNETRKKFKYHYRVTDRPLKDIRTK